MEIKATLQKPYTEIERIEFIIKNNHNKGYEIKETESQLQALGFTLEELTQQEAEKIANLKLTKREVFLALYYDSGITPDTLKSYISNPTALIEFEFANEYFRGNPLIDQIGNLLGYTKEQLDFLFKNKHFPAKGGETNA